MKTKQTPVDYQSVTKEPLTEGELLRKLCEWRGLKQEEFAALLDKSRHWYLRAIKFERIPDKEKFTIGRVLNIPMEYWSGEYVLPIHLPIAQEHEAATEYSNGAATERNQLALENSRLKDKIIELQEQLLAARSEIIDLKETIILSNK